MNWLKDLKLLFDPIARVIDDVHTSEEESLTLTNAFRSLQNEVTMGQLELVSQQLELEGKYAEQRASIIETEAKSTSWLTRNWRPLTMMVFLFLVVAHAFGFTDISEEFAASMMALIQLGIGGYIIGRSVEKTAPGLIKAIGRK